MNFRNSLIYFILNNLKINFFNFLLNINEINITIGEQKTL